MINAIIFDWFGVCTEKWINVWEHELSDKVEGKKLRESFFKYLDKYANNSITGKEFLKSICSEIDLDPEKYDYLLSTKGKINKELLEIIKKLKKKYKTAILSDNFNEIVPVFEREIGGFERYFDVIILSNRLNIGKTNPEIYKITLARLGINPINAIFIDDKEKNLLLARKLGIKTILYKNNIQLEKELVKHDIILP